MCILYTRTSVIHMSVHLANKITILAANYLDNHLFRVEASTYVQLPFVYMFSSTRTASCMAQTCIH